jgi:hypothetical protein
MQHETAIEPIRGLGDVSHEFRGIEGAASADRSNKANSLVPTKPHCPLDHMGRRIRFHVLKHDRAKGFRRIYRIRGPALFQIDGRRFRHRASEFTKLLIHFFHLLF